MSEILLDEVKGLATDFSAYRDSIDQRFEAFNGLLAKVQSQVKTSALSDPTVRRAAPFALPSLSEYTERKNLAIGNDPGGGYLVIDALEALVDRLRPTSALLQVPGIRSYPMTTSDHLVPRLTASSTAYAVAENGTVTASGPTFGQVRLRSYAYAARAIGSLEWFEDVREDSRALLADDMSKTLALKYDLDGLVGDGSSTSPLIGLASWVGVTTTTLGSGAGATPTLDDFRNAVYRLRAGNATPTAWIAHPRVYNTVEKIVTGIASDKTTLLSPNPSVAGPLTLFGIPFIFTTQIPITQVVGGSSDCTSVFLVDGSTLAMGSRGGATVIYDQYSLAANRQIAVTMSARLAFAVLDEAGVQVIAGVRP